MLSPFVIETILGITSPTKDMLPMVTTTKELTKDMITQNKNEIDEFLYVNAKLKYIVIDYTPVIHLQYQEHERIH